MGADGLILLILTRRKIHCALIMSDDDDNNNNNTVLYDQPTDNTGEALTWDDNPASLAGILYEARLVREACVVRASPEPRVTPRRCAGALAPPACTGECILVSVYYGRQKPAGQRQSLAQTARALAPCVSARCSQCSTASPYATRERLLQKCFQLLQIIDEFFGAV